MILRQANNGLNGVDSLQHAQMSVRHALTANATFDTEARHSNHSPD